MPLINVLLATLSFAWLSELAQAGEHEEGPEKSRLFTCTHINDQSGFTYEYSIYSRNDLSKASTSMVYTVWRTAEGRESRYTFSKVHDNISLIIGTDGGWNAKVRFDDPDTFWDVMRVDLVNEVGLFVFKPAPYPPQILSCMQFMK